LPKSKSPRKKYDPARYLHRIAANAERRRDANPLTSDQQRDLGLAYRLSFDTMLRGGSESAWHSLAASLNIALILCERRIGAEYEPQIKAAMQALMRCKYRQHQTGSWALDAAGIAALRTALEIHDAQVEIAERAEIRAAINEVHRRVETGDVYAEAA
jgi:hypothetical protein